MGNKTTKEELPAKEQKKSAFQRLWARFHIQKPEKWSPTKVNAADTKAQVPPPKPPLRNHAERINSKTMERDGETNKSEWTEVPLHVPDSPPMKNQEYEIKVTPIPPPRKHKHKMQEILNTPTRTNDLQHETPTAPVEEPIIVPKKVIEHVCDGTHHHVRNVVNGKVVDQILEHTDKAIKQNKSSAKNASTLSLPSYNDMKKKDEKRASSPSKSTKKKSSASSLPTDKKPKTAHSAAEKIESYMIRCKSFGSIIPHSKNEKPKPVEPDSDKESIDSWSGLEDWDLGIIEHDVSTELPRVPKKSENKLKSAQPSNKSPRKENTKINQKLDTDGIDQLIASIDSETLAKSPTSPSTQPELQHFPDIVEEATPPHHGSYPFKKTAGKSGFENDAFFTKEFLRNESNSSDIYESQKPSQIKLAPLAAFDSDKESEKDSNVDSNLYENLNGELNEQKKSVAFDLNDKKQITLEGQKYVEDEKIKSNVSITTDKNVPHIIPRRKSSTGHSKLLKFIKDTNANQPFENKANAKSTDDSIIYADNDEENIDKIEEPKIVPELRNVDRSWHNLIKRDDLNDIPLLEQESSISDLVETSSSDDTRSTTIETFQK